ncbi:MAG: sortase domain-containing protein [Euzebya sp.]
MKNNERIGVAVLAAAVGASVSALIGRKSKRTPRRTPQLELLAVNAPTLADLDSVEIEPDDTEATVQDVSLAEEEETTTDREGSARRLATVSSAVSYLSVGALIAVLVMWGAGAFDPRISQREIAASVLAAQQNAWPPAVQITPEEPAPLTGSEITQEEGFVAPVVPPEVDLPDPMVVQIPAIGVNASVISLNTDYSGALQVPEDFSQTGWWSGGPEPGEVGPAVIVGHVDSFLGPAVFYSLEELVYDDAITVIRGDGSAAVFAVRSTLNVEKSEFPTDLVYGETPDAQLRLVTCDGNFDDGSYLGNLIITAELIREIPPPSTGLVY